MRSILKLTIAPLGSLIIIMLGTGFFNTFVGVRLTTDGWPSFVTGLVYSAYYGGMMLGAIYMERLIRFTGHIRAFCILASITAATITLQGFTSSPFAWIFWRFITGSSCAGLFIVIESWLLLLSSHNTRGAALSLYMVGLYTAQAFGQFMLNGVDITSDAPFSLAVVFCTLSIIPVCFMRAAAPTPTEHEGISMFYLLRKVPLGFLGNFSAGLIISSFYALGPVYGKESGYSIAQISLIMFITIFGGMALQWPIGSFSDWIERRKVIVLNTFILAVISLTLFFYTTPPFPLLMLLLFFFGGFAFTLYPISITYCCDFFSTAGITSITCTALIIYGTGCILGPLFAPLVMESTSPSGLFLYCSIISFLLSLFAIWRLYKLPKESKETKESFQPIPNGTPSIGNLDPRIENE